MTMSVGVDMRASSSFLTHFAADDAASRLGDDRQTFLPDILSAVLATAVGAISDSGECRRNVGKLTLLFLRERAEQGGVLPRERLVRPVCLRRALEGIQLLRIFTQQA